MPLVLIVFTRMSSRMLPFRAGLRFPGNARQTQDLTSAGFLVKSNLQILPIVITPVSRCVYVSAYVKFVRFVCCRTAKIKEKLSMRFLLRHFDLNVPGQKVKNNHISQRASAKILLMTFMSVGIRY